MKGALMFGSLAFLGLAGLVSVDAPSRTAVPTEPKEAGIGRNLSGLTGKDLSGATIKVPVAGAKATVIAFTSTTCPLCLKFGPTLAELEKSYAAKGVKFVFVNPSDIETPAEIKDQIRRLGLKGPMLHDKDQSWVAKLDATTTTEAYLIDNSGKLRYRGAVDDQYAIGASLAKPRNRFLASALDSVLAGKDPKVQATKAPGCLLAELFASSQAIPTFHEKIQPIVQNKCMSCHRTGGAAPFPLETFEQVKSRGKMLDYVIAEGIMPPWFAAEGTGPWRNDISLSATEKALIKDWVNGGMPKGDAKKAPAVSSFEPGWTIGKPDAVFEMQEPISVPATGVMPYKNVNVPTNFTEDTWVEKIEVIPGDRRAVHHVLVFLKTPAEADRPGSAAQDELDEISGFFGAYVPGNSALVYPEGFSKKIPKGAVLRFQLHYTPFGIATQDQTKIGFVVAKRPPTQEVMTASLADLSFAIPPGADNHPVTARLKVPGNAEIISFLPHMHVRGKAARYELTSEGKTRFLLDVPRYDFNWQLNYVLQKPLPVKAGDVITYTAWFDNSDKNPANPDPTQTVRWGLQTFEEMHLGYIEYIVPGQKPGEGKAPLKRGGINFGIDGAELRRFFDRLDRNKDGSVTKQEAGFLWQRVSNADDNGDGKITFEEVKALFGVP